MKIEEQLEARGYELVDEQSPFRIYEKHRKRIIYHVPSAKIWSEIDFRLTKDFVRDVKK